MLCIIRRGVPVLLEKQALAWKRQQARAQAFKEQRGGSERRGGGGIRAGGHWENWVVSGQSRFRREVCKDRAERLTCRATWGCEAGGRSSKGGVSKGRSLGQGELCKGKLLGVKNLARRGRVHCPVPTPPRATGERAREPGPSRRLTWTAGVSPGGIWFRERGWNLRVHV